MPLHGYDHEPHDSSLLSVPWHFIQWVAKELAKFGPAGLLNFAMFALVFAGMAAGLPPGPLVAAAAILSGGYHLRETENERHRERTAEQEANRVQREGEAMKGRYRRLSQSHQPDLPLAGDLGTSEQPADGGVVEGMDLTNTNSLALIAAIELAVAIPVYFSWVRTRIQRRRSQLANAIDLLKRHYADLQAFLDDPAAPTDLKLLLVQVSDATVDRQISHNIARHLIDAPEGPEERTLLHALDDLAKDHRDLADLFARSVATGMLAMFLRWPENASLFDQFAARFASDPRKEATFATRIARGRQSAAPIGRAERPAYA